MTENPAFSQHEYDDGTFNPHSDGTAPAKPAKAKKAAEPEADKAEAKAEDHKSAGGRAGHRA